MPEHDPKWTAKSQSEWHILVYRRGEYYDHMTRPNSAEVQSTIQKYFKDAAYDLRIFPPQSGMSREEFSEVFPSKGTSSEDS